MIKSPQVTQRVLNEGLEMRAHLVIIVGSRHILWDMDKNGNLADKPRLVGMASTWDREKVRIGRWLVEGVWWWWWSGTWWRDRGECYDFTRL